MCLVCLFGTYGLRSFFARLFNLDILCCLFIWGFTFFSLPLPLIYGIFALPNLFTSSGVFGVCNLCFSMSASILAFSIMCLFASISFESFCPCILLAFSSASLFFILLCSDISLISIVFWPVALGYFVYINIFVIWYLLSLYFNISVQLHAFFES